jgi:3-mercaptopyruvate sulfurtransferase SseA
MSSLMCNRAFAHTITMKTFLSGNELSRRLGLAQATFRQRLQQRGIEADGVVVVGQKKGLLFDAERVPTLRRALVVPTAIEAEAR